MNRRGVTLIELLIGMVLLAGLGVAITETLMATSRVTVRSMHALAIARTMLATGALLREELGNSDAGEVLLVSPTAVNFSRTVGSMSVCGALGSVVRLPASEWMGVRWPEEGRDEAVLLSEVATGRWSLVPIIAVSTGRCPDGSDAIQLSLAADAATAVFVRIGEPVQLRGYVAGGNGWWGLAPVSGPAPIQPFAGPLDPALQPLVLTTAGLALTFCPAFGSAAVLRTPLGSP